MADEVIDLIDEDSSQPRFALPPAPPTTPLRVPHLVPALTMTDSSDSEERTPANPGPAFKVPSLFNDEDDIGESPASQPITSRNPSTTYRLSMDFLEDSDEELRELYKEAKRQAQDTSEPRTNPTPSRFRTETDTAGPSSKSVTIAHPATVKPARPITAGSSAAEFLGEDGKVATSMDPVLLEEEDDYFINPSLSHPNAVSATEEKQEIDPDQMRQLLELNEKSSDATQEMDTPIEMKSLLMKHQRQALYWMVNRESEDNPPGHPRGGILADDQGFGKTVTLIALLLKNRPQPDSGEGTSRWGNLIVTPTSVLNQWAAELREHIEEQFRPRILIYHGPNKPKNARTLTLYDVVLTTYGTLAQEYPKVLDKDKGIILKTRKPGNLYKINWFRVVLDEGQAIRNFRRETFKAAVALNARRKWSLTGTPIQNTVNDIYSQFMFLGYHVTATYKEWEMKYKRPLEGTRCPPARFERFQAILGVVLLRRAKYDKIDNKPVIELPPKNMTTLDLKFSRTERLFYESQEERAVSRLHREAGRTANDFALALHIMLRLRQACGHPALCLWNTGEEFKFSDDELDVVELRMKTKCMFNMLPEQIRNRLFNELGPNKSVPQNCPICLDVIESGVVTKCGHLFCVSDYEEWRREKDSCPSCRGNLVGEDDVMTLDEVRKEIHAIARRKRREEEAKLAKAEPLSQVSLSKAEPINLGNDPGKTEPISLDSLANAEPITLGSTPSGMEPIALGHAASTDGEEINAHGKRGAVSSSAEPSSKKPHLCGDASAESDVSDDEDEESPVQQGEAENEKRAAKLKTSAKIKRFMMEYEKIHSETDDKVLCFSQWTRMLDLVEDSLKEQMYEYVRLDGTMSTTQREEKMRLFKTRSKCRLFLISLTAGSTGLNLTVANRVFLLDSWWNPAVESQAIDRVHRIGQKKPVEVVKLKIGGTVEERILGLQERKRQIIDGALGVEGLKTMGRRRLTMRDLMGLFEGVAENVANRAENRQNGEMATVAREVMDMAQDMGASGGGGNLDRMLRYR